LSKAGRSLWVPAAGNDQLPARNERPCERQSDSTVRTGDQINFPRKWIAH
jgi:hypothetical protein